MGDPKHISDVLGKRDIRLVVSKPEKTSPVKKRLIEAAVKLATEGSEGILFQHSLLCQVSLPYRSQGKAKTWIRQCGKASFHMMSGSAYNPLDHTYVEMGLPYGVKPRVLLCHLNTEALLQGDPVIEVEDSMTAFARRLGIPTTGPHLLKLQKQIAYLGAARCQLSFADPENPRRSLNIKTDIISAYDVWFPKDGRQRVFWTSIIELDPRYYASLAEHAVPLPLEAIAALSHNARALDIFQWLAQRLHRIKLGKQQRISWPALMHQFYQPHNPNQDHSRMVRNFRLKFRADLKRALCVYPRAKSKIEDTKDGLLLSFCQPPVPRKAYLIKSS